MIGIISTEPGEGGGAEVVLEHLLRGWQQANLPIKLMTPPQSRVGRVAKELSLPLVPIEVAKDSFFQHLKALRDNAAAMIDCHLIHAWHSRSFDLAWRLGRRLGVPSTATLHDHPQCITHSLIRRYLIKSSARKLSALVSVSDANRQAWQETGCEVPVEVIHNGFIDLDNERHLQSTPVIGFLGMYSEWKGFDIVAEWIDKTKSENAKWHLYGNVIDSWKNRAAEIEANSSGAVSVLGHQPLERIFSEIDILVHASTEFEPFGNVLVEAARASVPVLASRSGGPSEIVVHGKTGFLFDPTNPDGGLTHLNELIQQSDLRKNLGLAARQHFEENFQLHQMVEAYKNFWDQMTDLAG